MIISIRLNKKSGMFAVQRKDGNNEYSLCLKNALDDNEWKFVQEAESRNETPYMIRWA